MCCDLCDYYFRCEDTEHESALCCSKCDDQNGCHEGTVSGRHMMGYEDDYDDLLDDANGDANDDDDYEDDDYDYDYEDDDSSSIH